MNDALLLFRRTDYRLHFRHLNATFKTLLHAMFWTRNDGRDDDHLFFFSFFSTYFFSFPLFPQRDVHVAGSRRIRTKRHRKLREPFATWDVCRNGKRVIPSCLMETERRYSVYVYIFTFMWVPEAQSRKGEKICSLSKQLRFDGLSGWSTLMELV